MAQILNASGTYYSNYGNVAVSQTPILVLAANQNRQEMRFINYSTNPDCFLGMDSNVTITTGFPLFSGSEQDASRGFGSMYLGNVYAVNGTGSSDLRYWEVCR